MTDYRPHDLDNPLVAALIAAPWDERFLTVADWLDAVDDHDKSVLADAAKELRRRVERLTEPDFGAGSVLDSRAGEWLS